MNLKQLLREQTYKEDGIELEKRVFYTLMHKTPPDVDIRTHRTAKLLSLLIAKLASEGHLSDPDIDNLLIQTIR